ncbi:hypothetical protein HKX48_000703 [Thoreauomyces humboldtii]|nr:hypothetical protein HKX48_000703 [Thoreauomyces humboldtii]
MELSADDPPTRKNSGASTIATLPSSRGSVSSQDDDDLPAPPTRRRGSVLDDAIMRDMLAARVPDPNDVDEDTLEGIERSYNMLRFSKRYRRQQVQNANMSCEPCPNPPGNAGMSTIDMSARRTSMSHGVFGAGRHFAASELDAALEEMGAAVADSGPPSDLTSSPPTTLDRTSTRIGSPIPGGLLKRARPAGDEGPHGRTVRFNDVIEILGTAAGEGEEHEDGGKKYAGDKGSGGDLGSDATISDDMAPAAERRPSTVKKIARAMKKALTFGAGVQTAQV